MEEPTTTSSIAAEQKYAGFWIRFLAYIIDLIILGVIGKILFGSQVTQYQAGRGGMSFSVDYSGWRVIIPLAYVVGCWIAFSATPGKMICKLKITQENGQKLTPQTALLRLVGYAVSAIVVFIGFITIGFDKKKQGWHDKIAHTYVVKV